MKKQEEKSKRNEIYRGVMIAKDTDPQKRIMVGIPMTGLIRSEWMHARYGQVVPCNWSQTELIQWIDQTSPLRFQVSQARNIIVRECLTLGFQWLLFIDHDVMLPPLFFCGINEYMLDGNVPVLGGLYFTKSVPSEPLTYRGRGNSYYNKWKMGDKVWLDGFGMGSTLIHSSILRAMYEESDEYEVAGQKIRRVFEEPARVWYDPEKHTYLQQSGTEDLEFCWRLKRDGIFKKAGWPEYQRKKYPILCDTRFFCWHINFDGVKYPARGEHLQYVKEKK